MSWTAAHLGELAALGTALCWTFTSLAFAAAGRRLGPTRVNLIRLILAAVILGVGNRLLFGDWIPPVDATGFAFLALSGLIGLTLGDQLLFIAFVDVGPRLTTLLMTLAPPIAAVVAWPALGEPLGLMAILGMSVTMAGIAMVVRERPRGTVHVTHRRRMRGIVFGLLSAACQGVGLVLGKIGMGHTRLPEADHLDPWSATFVRMVVAAVGMILVLALRRAWRTRRALDSEMAISAESEHLPNEALQLKHATARARILWALGFTVLGTVFGPVTGVWLSMVAVDLTEAGIAATLMAMSPVTILPLAILLEKEHVSWRAWIGAIIAVAGVGILTFGRPAPEPTDVTDSLESAPAAVAPLHPPVLPGFPDHDHF